MVSRMFSTRNWPTSVRAGAPKALRTPISEARSMIRLMLMFTRFTVGMRANSSPRAASSAGQLPHLAVGTLPVAGRHETRECFDLGLERRDDRLVVLRIGQLGTEQPRVELLADRRHRRPVPGQGHGVPAAHDFALVGVGLGGRVWHPDFRVRLRAQLRHVLDDANHAEALTIGLERLPDGGTAARRIAAVWCALITATNRASATSSVPNGAAFEEPELQDSPELVVGSLERRTRSSCRRGRSARSRPPS